MRRTLPLALFALLAILVLAPAPVGAADLKPAPKDLGEMAERLHDLAKRIEALVAEANKDPDEARIDLYMSYTPLQMKKLRGRVEAEELVRFMLDSKKDFPVREKAFKALAEGALFRGDPDLSKTEKRGTRSKRAYFCDKFLRKELDNDDRIVRKFVHDLLMQLWFGRQSRIPEIDRYNPSDPKTWKAAESKWAQHLKKS